MGLERFIILIQLMKKVLLFTFLYSATFTIAKAQVTAVTTIAVLPFNVSADTNNLSAGVLSEDVVRSENISRYRFQQNLYIRFLKKAARLKIIFQDVSKTNDLLKDSLISDSINVRTKEQLCNTLGVDAVMLGDVQILLPKAKLSSAAIKGVTRLGIGTSKTVKLQLTLYGSAGNVLWQKTYDDSSHSSPDVIIDRLMRRASKDFNLQQ